MVHIAQTRAFPNGIAFREGEDRICASRPGPMEMEGVATTDVRARAFLSIAVCIENALIFGVNDEVIQVPAFYRCAPNG